MTVGRPVSVGPRAHDVERPSAVDVDVRDERRVGRGRWCRARRRARRPARTSRAGCADGDDGRRCDELDRDGAHGQGPPCCRPTADAQASGGRRPASSGRGRYDLRVCPDVAPGGGRIVGGCDASSWHSWSWSPPAPARRRRPRLRPAFARTASRPASSPRSSRTPTSGGCACPGSSPRTARGPRSRRRWTVSTSRPDRRAVAMSSTATRSPSRSISRRSGDGPGTSGAWRETS